MRAPADAAARFVKLPPPVPTRTITGTERRNVMRRSIVFPRNGDRITVRPVVVIAETTALAVIAHTAPPAVQSRAGHAGAPFACSEAKRAQDGFDRDRVAPQFHIRDREEHRCPGWSPGIH
jgi:hypothetical protein